jgi:hypothetical protein
MTPRPSLSGAPPDGASLPADSRLQPPSIAVASQAATARSRFSFSRRKSIPQAPEPPRTPPADAAGGGGLSPAPNRASAINGPGEQDPVRASAAAGRTAIVAELEAKNRPGHSRNASSGGQSDGKKKSGWFSRRDKSQAGAGEPA